MKRGYIEFWLNGDITLCLDYFNRQQHLSKNISINVFNFTEIKNTKTSLKRYKTK